MKKNKTDWVNDIMNALDHVDQTAFNPDSAYVDALKSRLQSHTVRELKVISLHKLRAVAAAIAILILANASVMIKVNEKYADRVDSYMEHQNVYPIIPVE